MTVINADQLHNLHSYFSSSAQWRSYLSSRTLSGCSCLPSPPTPSAPPSPPPAPPSSPPAPTPSPDCASHAHPPCWPHPKNHSSGFFLAILFLFCSKPHTLQPKELKKVKWLTTHIQDNSFALTSAEVVVVQYLIPLIWLIHLLMFPRIDHFKYYQFRLNIWNRNIFCSSISKDPVFWRATCKGSNFLIYWAKKKGQKNHIIMANIFYKKGLWKIEER